MRRTLAIVLALVLLTSLAVAVVGCGSSGDGEGSEPSGTIENVEQQANMAVREANLRQIDAAIQVYYASNGSYPTEISQLSSYLVRGVPTDPMGGTYYLANEGGVPKAAVR